MPKFLPRFLLWTALTAALFASAADPRAGEATLYRDEFGIPHIFAADLASAAFVVGYAQAQDRLEELLKNYRRANGRMAEVFGTNYFREDVAQRLFRHAEISRKNYPRLSPTVRKVIEQFQKGIQAFMQEYPAQVPKWAQPIQPEDVVALGRYIIYGWPVGEALYDLEQGGLKMEDPAYRGSNEILLAPSRTAAGVPIAIIDPHLSWYGEFRFYQVRIYAGDYNASGVSILGTPLPALGHNRFASIAMTTGGPDTSDIYEETLNPANPRQYQYDGRWRDLEVRTERIAVKNGDQVEWRIVENEYTHHGPVVAHRNGKAYAMAIPYADEVNLMDQTYEMMMARNLSEMLRALGRLQLMGQNVMIGTVQGDIYYLRNGRVPIRAAGIDTHKPIPGNRSATEWRGLHPLSDLVQITNPPAGYMHNNNVTPFAMMEDSPLTPERYSQYPYLYNATRNAPRHQRGEMMTELLAKSRNVTVEQAINLAFDTEVYQAGKWQARLTQAISSMPEPPSPEAAELARLIAQWNRRSDPASTGAMAFYAFKKGLGESLAAKTDPPASLSDAEILAGLAAGAQWLKKTFNSLTVPFGSYFRVGRETGEKTWPVGGGSLTDAGMATTRAIGFKARGREMIGQKGQTSTQIVILSDPPESYTVIPLGASDHPESGHWDDQAEKLFSQGKAARTWFLRREELAKHTTSTNHFTVRE